MLPLRVRAERLKRSRSAEKIAEVQARSIQAEVETVSIQENAC